MALVPPVVSDIIVDTESLVGRCLGKKCQEKYNKRKRGEANQCLEEEKYFFHIALLGGSQVATQS